DLIVVGTKDALTMVEAGADEIPEDELLEALELAHQHIIPICEAQEELARQVGKPKWIDLELTEEVRTRYADRFPARSQEVGLREAGPLVDELMDELAPALTMASTQEDITRRMQVRWSLSALLDQERLAAVAGPVRQQFETDLRALTEAEQDSKE